jgi:putative transposase
VVRLRDAASGASDLREWISVYARRGLPAAEIRRRLEIARRESVSESMVEACLLELQAASQRWQQRTLEPSYALIVFETLGVKFAENHRERNRSCHLALGLHADGSKEVLGVWLEEAAEGPPWRRIVGDLCKRGVQDVLVFIAEADLRTEAQRSFPLAHTHTHVAGLVRASLGFVSSQRRSTVARALRPIYLSSDGTSARHNLEEFAAGDWGRVYPAIAPLWRRQWDDVVRFLSLPVDLRRVLVSTYAIDSLAREVKRALRSHGQFHSEAEAIGVLYLVVSARQDTWRRPQREWHAAKSQFALLFPERFQLA